MTFKPREELERNYDMIIPFTENHGLILVILKDWKRILKENKDDNWKDMEDDKLLRRIDDSVNPSKMVYENLIKKKVELPEKKAEKWNQDLNTTRKLSKYLSLDLRLLG